ncbi:MAG TPA: hypothetical protein VGG06_30700 [Thermoanaerobaculia bacterium]|jgi:hypothetical protein
MAKIIRTACWARLIACVAIFLGSLPSEGESVVLADDFSTGIESWTYAEDLGGRELLEDPWAIMTWDPTEGRPDPGSLVLANLEPSSRIEGYWALGPCMESFPLETWLTRSMVKKTGSVFGHCEAYVSLFGSPDCSGEGTVIGGAIGVPPIPQDVWLSRQRSSPPLPTTRSARPALVMSVSPGTTISCHFDSVVVTVDRGAAATDVPALSAVGLMIMASVLVALAVAVLARRRVERARPRR